MPIVTNPILPGFHPDPSICRAGDTYCLATSTFEWWPGVRLHRSRDIARWELVGGALTRPSQLDLRGNPDSGGVWAPALSHADGRFWLVFSDMKAFQGPSKDVRNYLVTAPRLEGPWSDPVPLNSSGFDPSLFHDDDGRKYLLNQLWLPRPDEHPFAGIVLQEYDPEARRLVGPRVNIFTGSPLRVTEGPHLLKRDGYYWLIVAEGGTGCNHAVTVARSRSLLGPYEVHPDNPLLTSRDAPPEALQKAGHASFVETPGGEWPRLAGGGRHPHDRVEVPGPAGEAPPYLQGFADDFAAPELHLHWNTLRGPAEPSWLSLAERPGHLRLRGRHSLYSHFDQSLVGFRLLHHRARAEVVLDFQPSDPLQRAGLALYYDTRNHVYLYLAGNAAGGRELRLSRCDNNRVEELLLPPVVIAGPGPVRLAVELHDLRMRFWCTPPGAAEALPASDWLSADLLGDEHPESAGIGWAFTGTFVALCAQDSGDAAPPADFSAFRYEGR